jgi:hypothetical protein
MNEREFYRWLRAYSGVSSQEQALELKAEFAGCPEADEIISQAIAEKLSLSEVEPLLWQEESEPAEPATASKSSIFSKMTGAWKNKPKMRMSWKPIAIGAGALIIVVLAIFAFSYFGGQGSANPDIIYNEPSKAPANDAPAITNDQDFWSVLAQTEVPELSPGNLNGKLNAKTAVGIVLMLVLTLWAIGEGAVRKKGQNGALFFSIVALCAGWLTMPILVAISDVQTVGWFFVWSVFLAILWALSISTTKSQNDLSPITVALALFTASLFYIGKLSIIKAIGALFGLTWVAWTHVTSLGGVVTLLMTGRGADSLLTVLILILSLCVIFLASKEVGKKHGHWAAMLIGSIIVIAFYLANWGLNSGVNYLVNTQNLSVTVTVVLKVLVPILSWVVSLLISVGIGVALGDVEVGRQENRQNIGLQKTGTFVQNIADFGILGTIIPLFLGVIIVL